MAPVSETFHARLGRLMSMSLPIEAATLHVEAPSLDNEDEPVLLAKCSNGELECVLRCFVGRKLMSPKLSFLVPTFLKGFELAATP